MTFRDKQDFLCARGAAIGIGPSPTAAKLAVAAARLAHISTGATAATGRSIQGDFWRPELQPEYTLAEPSGCPKKVRPPQADQELEAFGNRYASRRGYHLMPETVQSSITKMSRIRSSLTILLRKVASTSSPFWCSAQSSECISAADGRNGGRGDPEYEVQGKQDVDILESDLRGVRFLVRSLDGHGFGGGGLM